MVSYLGHSQIQLWQIEYALGQDSILVTKPDGELEYVDGLKWVVDSIGIDTADHTLATKNETFTGSRDHNLDTYNLRFYGTGARSFTFESTDSWATFNLIGTIPYFQINNGTNLWRYWASGSHYYLEPQTADAEWRIRSLANSNVLTIATATGNLTTEGTITINGDKSGVLDSLAGFNSSNKIIAVAQGDLNLSDFNDDLTHYDANAIHDNEAGEINGITEKATPVSGDLLIIEDSADSNNKKKVQIGNLPYSGLWDGVSTDFLEPNSAFDVVRPHSYSAIGTNIMMDANGKPSVTGTYNMAVGYDALNSITVGGTDNIGIGRSAAETLTTGDYNISMGYRSLFTNSTHTGNIAIGREVLENTINHYNFGLGYFALNENTTGTGNVALGFDAMRYGTTGRYNIGIGYEALEGQSGSTLGNDYNVALGYRALQKNTTGDGNLAIGYYALNVNTTGSYNAAISRSSLVKNTTGSYNSAFGYQALFDNFDGDYNVAFGYNSMQDLLGDYNVGVGYLATSGTNGDTGSENVGIGRQALDDVDGSYNTAIGSQALLNMTTGDQNVAIGRLAGQSNITGDRNVFIGAYAGSSETGSDKLSIENSNDTNGLIEGDFASDYLTLNTDYTTISSAGTGVNENVELKLDNDADAWIFEGTGTSATLRVKPETNDRDFEITDEANDPKIFVEATTNYVEINGNRTPQQDLDVSGGVKIDGGIYDSSNDDGDDGDRIVSDGADGWTWVDNPAGAMHSTGTQTGVTTAVTVTFNAVDFEDGTGIDMDIVSEEIEILSSSEYTGIYEITFSAGVSGQGFLKSKNNGSAMNWYDGIYIQFNNATSVTETQTVLMELSNNDDITFTVEASSGTVDLKEARCMVRRVR